MRYLSSGVPNGLPTDTSTRRIKKNAICELLYSDIE